MTAYRSSEVPQSSSPPTLAERVELVVRRTGSLESPLNLSGFSKVPMPAKAPDPAVAPDAGDFFRVVLLDHIETCNEEDCGNDTRLAVESRDAAALPYCHAHAHVLFADWMVGA